MKNILLILCLFTFIVGCKEKEDVAPRVAMIDPTQQEGSFIMTISDIDARTWTSTSYEIVIAESNGIKLAYITAKNAEGDLHVTIANSDLNVPMQEYSNGLVYNDYRYEATYNGISGYNQHRYNDVLFTITEKTNKYVRGTFVVNSQPTNSHYTPPKITSGEFKLYYKEGNTLYFQ